MFKYPWFCFIDDSSKDKLISLFRGCSVWLPYFLCDLISSSGCGCLHFYCNFTLVTYNILILHLLCSSIYLHLSLLFINSVILDAMLFINKWLKFSVDIIFKIPLVLVLVHFNLHYKRCYVSRCMNISFYEKLFVLIVCKCYHYNFVTGFISRSHNLKHSKVSDEL